MDPDTHHGVVVSGDVVEAGGSFLDALSPYTADQVAESLEQYARLHSFTWTAPEWRGHDWLKSPREWFMQARGLPDIERNFDGVNGAGRARGGPRRATPARRLRGTGGATRPASTAGRSSTVTRTSATCSSTASSDPAWSTGRWCRTGRGASTSGTTWRRRCRSTSAAAASATSCSTTSTRSKSGVEPPAWDEAWEQYRRGIVYGYFLWGITRLVDAPIIAELLTRLGTATHDHDSFGAVGV